MRILVDENIPKVTVQALKEKGHDVLDLRGTDKEGVTDSIVWKTAVHENRLLITTDKWFAGNSDQPHPGVLIILLKQPNSLRIHDRILMAVENFAHHTWPGQIVIMRDKVQSVRKIR